MKVSVATCVNCGTLVTVTDVAVYHTGTGCVSCQPIRCVHGKKFGDTYAEPPDMWTRPRAEV